MNWVNIIGVILVALGLIIIGLYILLFFAGAIGLFGAIVVLALGLILIVISPKKGRVRSV